MLKGELNGFSRRIEEKVIDEPEYQIPLFTERNRYERYTTAKQSIRGSSGREVLHQRRRNRKNGKMEKSGKSVAKCLCAKGNSLQSQMQIIQDQHGMRRLTAVECERLMDWPDNWLKFGIDKDGNQFEQADRQRCKQAGNGVVAKVVYMIMQSIFK